MMEPTWLNAAEEANSGDCRVGMRAEMQKYALAPLENFGVKVDSVESMAKSRGWSPYMDNGGAIVAITGDDFCVVGADTRLLGRGYSIMSRNFPRIVKLTEKCMLATAGMQADTIALHKIMKARLKMYEFQHRKVPSIEAISTLLSRTLYQRRFFPLYTFNLLVGLGESGGIAYAYDAVGSNDTVKYAAQGEIMLLGLSILDVHIDGQNRRIKKPSPTKLEAIDLVKDTMTFGAARHIGIGDTLEVYVLDSTGVSFSTMPLKTD